MSDVPQSLAAKLAQFSTAQWERLKERLQEQQAARGLPSQIPRRSPEQGIPLSPRKAGKIGWPLSPGQERLWFLEQFQEIRAAYNIYRAVQMEGPLDCEVLKQSIQAIVERHEALRTLFQMQADVPLQVVAPHPQIDLPVVDLRDIPIQDRASHLKYCLQAEAQTPFDLTQDLPIRINLFCLADRTHVLSVAMHHIAGDGWSLGILAAELSELYSAYLQGEDSPLPSLPIQYPDFALWQHQQLSSPLLQDRRSYWQQKLIAPLPVVELPSDRPRPPLLTYRGAKYSLTLPLDLVRDLKALSQREGVTLFATLLAAFKVLLYRYTHQTDLIVGTPISGRTQLETEPSIGFFVNTLALRSDLSGNPSFLSLLKQVHQTALEAYTHQQVPFAQVVADLGVEREMGRSPLVQVMFGLQNTPERVLQLPGLKLGPAFAPTSQLQSAVPLSSYSLAVDTATARFDLSLLLKEESGRLSGFMEYSQDLFDEATIARMASHFQGLLEEIAANPEQSIAMLPLLTEAERHQLLVEWNDTQTDYPQDKCVHQLFEEQVERIPNAVAIVFGEQQLTYRQLNQRANKLARHLQSLGVGPEVSVGICVERSLEMVVGLLGILKAGGAYVPLDPNYPRARLRFMLEDAQITFVVIQKSLQESLPSNLPIQTIWLQQIDMNPEAEVLAQDNLENPVTEIVAENLAYIPYTSGSTGAPKGVEVVHRGITRLARNTQYASIQPSDICLQLAPLSFDASSFEIWGCLLNGAQLVVMPPQPPTLSELGNTIRKHNISILWLTAGLFHLMVEQQLSDLTSVRQLLAGGDVLSVSHIQKFTSAHPHCQVVNGYGPTENTTFTCCYPVTHCEELERSAPIGRPIANTTVYILDSYLQPVAIGVPGELYAGGDGLARGYLNQPELTTERFIPNLFDRESVSRLYKTGDLARYLPDGNIEFLGRIDNQVKIRGFRIELGEVEAVLLQLPNVVDGLVLAREDIPGDKRLVAYVVPTQKQALTLDTLRNFMKQKLPSYMVPNIFLVLEAFPLTPNGKIDRRALPVPDRCRQNPESTYIAPRTPVEQKLAEIWAKVLWLEHEISIHDNFFDLGGHSLLSVRLVAEIEQVFKQELPVAALFQLSTIAELAPLLEPGKEVTGNEASQGRLIPLKAGDRNPAKAAVAPRSLDSAIYHKLLAFTAGWGGKRIAANALSVGMNTDGISQPLYWCLQGFRELKQLARYLGTDRPVYGMRSGHHAMQYTDSNIAALATHYVREILAVQPKGPYLIGGNCQGGRIAFEIAQQLWQRGQAIALLALLEVPKPKQYPGRLALLFGRDSHLSPYRSYRWPEWGWRKFYPSGFSVDLIPCQHGKFFDEPNVQILAKHLLTHIQEVPTTLTSSKLLPDRITYDLLPDAAYRAQLTSPPSLTALAGELIDISVTVKNISPFLWLPSTESGITLGNHWLDRKGNVVCWSDGRVTLLEELPANAEVALTLSVTAPMDVGDYILELDLVEEGVVWFKEKGSSSARTNVKVSHREASHGQTGCRGY
ncbi:non-ribosomal peptide synthetase [Synechococcus sp. PCC 7336]|uniref:non-ribosomal peptide synthetase n=1 Tax=Synechococcus sp. PCC 7336 TaxID=195250 RepID=UPI0003488967|nr:non-ribosomal peptide synthetase [Synechococcus sp. PCC 7336]